MTTRKSFQNPERQQAGPLPAASRIGNIIVTSAIAGDHPKTREFPPDVAGQCANMFATLRSVLAEAGATPEDVIKMDVWLADPTQRNEVNVEWEKMFPDPTSRPVRHTLRAEPGRSILVQCQVMAIVGG